MKSVKTVIFDFDGTLCDSLGPSIDIINRYSDEFGFAKTRPEDLPRLREKSSQELFKDLGVSLIKLPFLVKKVQADLHSQIHLLLPVPGIPEVLKELKNRKYRIGVLTSNSVENVLKFVDVHQIEKFEFVYSGSSLFGKDKVLKSLMKKHEIAPQEAVYVGDETRDIEAARNAKMHMISVSWGFNSRAILNSFSPDHLIDQPGELLELFVG